MEERISRVLRLIRNNGVATDNNNTPQQTIEIPTNEELNWSREELENAALTPKCIVANHTYADVAQVVAPGGTGKTTILLYESIRIALGGELWGLPVESPGWTLFITAEDQREYLLGRMREIFFANDIRDHEQEFLMDKIRIYDVTGLGHKLIHNVSGNLHATAFANAIIERFADDPPTMIIFDPLASFGAGEDMINVNEQSIIDVCRRLVRALECCVKVIHHTGKANARNGTLDQYSGRGGSALADGSRMTTVMKRWTGGDLTPPGCLNLTDTTSITIMARAKLTYAPPNLPLIWIARDGFIFSWATAEQRDPQAQFNARMDKILRFITEKLESGLYPNKRMIEDFYPTLGLKRFELREALNELELTGKLVKLTAPRGTRKTGPQDYLCPRGLVNQLKEEEIE